MRTLRRCNFCCRTDVRLFLLLLAFGVASQAWAENESANVPPLPPHITMKQAKSYLEALMWAKVRA